MADKLEVTISQKPSFFEVSAEMHELDKLPAKIFLYENNGTATLGSYIGVCSVSDIGSRQEWTGVAIPTFGNRYVRHDVAYTQVQDATLAAQVAANIVASVRRLKATYAEPESSTIIYEV